MHKVHKAHKGFVRGIVVKEVALMGGDGGDTLIR